MTYASAGPTIEAFHRSRAAARALVGPIFGGRKTGAYVEILGRVDAHKAQRSWRWAIVAPSFDDIEASILSGWHKIVPAAQGKFRSEGVPQHYLPMRDYDGIQRGELDVRFYGLDRPDHRRKFASLEVTGVLLVNARELDEQVFDDGLDMTGTYPSGLEGGPLWSGLVACSRMPHPGHWLLRRPEDPGDLVLFKQPGGRSPAAENLANLPAGFYDKQAARYKSPDRVRSDIDAEPRTSAAETAQEATRARVRESFEEFVRLAMPDLYPARHHRLLMEKLAKVERGEISRLMLFLPPGAAKSSYGTMLFPAWYMGRHPTAPIICASHTRELAERFGRRVRNLVAAPFYRDCFGVGLSPDSGAAGRWSNDRGGEYFAVGVDGSVTGRRAALAIIDDPVRGRAEADSPTSRQHVWDWFQADLRTRLLPNAAVIVIMTRWHDDDLAGRLLEEAKAGGEQWEVVSLPAIAVAGEPDPLGRQPGERLWPEWFTQEQMETAQRDLRNWSALYQQRPMPESGDFFKVDWFNWYDEAPPRDRLRIYGASDFAVTKDGGDYTCHLVAGVDVRDDLYLLDCWHQQTSSDVWCETQLDLIERYHPLEWAHEAGQLDKGIGPFLEKRQRERGLWVFRRRLATVGDKSVRAQSIRARCAQGKVFLPRRAPWAPGFVDELLRFPAGRHDDMVDSFGLLGQLLPRMAAGPQPRQPKPGGLPQLGVELDDPYEHLSLPLPGEKRRDAPVINLWDTAPGGRLYPYGGRGGRI